MRPSNETSPFAPGFASGTGGGHGGRAGLPARRAEASSAATIEDTRQWTLPELARSGFSEGRNLIVDARFGAPAEMPGRKLVESKPDAILTFGGEALNAAHAATSTVPIVSFGPDLVALGLAESSGRQCHRPCDLRDGTRRQATGSAA